MFPNSNSVLYRLNGLYLMILSMVLFGGYSFCYAQFTVINNTQLNGVYYSSAVWGDYDNDGDLDVLLAGLINAGSYVSKIYRNNGNNSFIDINAGLPAVTGIGSASWGDYDNDGDLDILLGSNIYRNDGNDIFININAGIPAPRVISVSTWGDFDNDGDLDVIVWGTYHNGVFWYDAANYYRNDGNGLFTYIYVGLGGGAAENPSDYSIGSLTVGDYDNDGDLDLLLTGNYNNGIVSILYRNNGNNTFTDIAAGFTGVYNSSSAMGDYDNDGDLDILLTGSTITNTYISKLYRNDGNNTFVENNISLVGVANSSVAWGDYDNDGDLDMLISGETNSDGYITKIYSNNGDGTFSDIVTNLSGSGYGSKSWGDYDNDGDLDLLLTGRTASSNYNTILYRNDCNIPNTRPVAPNGLRTNILGSYVQFLWDEASDTQTPAMGLNYVLRIGTTPGGSQITAPMANSLGYRSIPLKGYANSSCTWKISSNILHSDNVYYWSVQAIDTSFAGSAFSNEKAINWVRVLTPNGGENWQSNTSRTVHWPAVNTNDYVNIFLSVDNGSSWIMQNTTPVNASLGRFSLILPNTTSSQCLIKIEDSNNTSLCDISDSVFTISSSFTPGVYFISPSTPKLQAGNSIQITWVSIGVSNVNIDYSFNYGITWNTIASNLPSVNGTCIWDVPDTLVTACYIRVSDFNNQCIYDWSDDPFYTCRLTVTSPNGYNVWVEESSHAITWNYTEEGDLKIEYTVDNGANWFLIAENVSAESGSYLWALPATSSEHCKVKITDMMYLYIWDVSDVYFTIRPPLILTYPNGNEVINIGDSCSIQWSASAEVSLILLDYSIDNGVCWLPILSSAYPASIGWYNWTIQDIPSSNCLVRVRSYSDNQVYDVSNGVFTIRAVDPLLEIFPSHSLDFGVTYLNTISFRELWIKNIGASTLLVDSLAFMFTNSIFTVDDLLYPISIIEGDSTAIQISFYPLTTGLFSDSLYIYNNSVNLPSAAIRLSGTGQFVPPLPPENVALVMIGNDAVISWDSVTETEEHTPFESDYYLVFSCPSSPYGVFGFLGATPSLQYTHYLVGLHSPDMFYRVRAYKYYGRGDGDITRLGLVPGMREDEVLRKLNVRR